jgi:adenosylcobinamide-GDP ribazoletransferase
LQNRSTAVRWFRTGVYAIAAIVLTIYGKMLAYNFVLTFDTLPVILIAPIISCSLVATTSTVLSYARTDGTANAFSKGKFFPAFSYLVTLTAGISAYLLRIPGLILFGIAILTTVLFCILCYPKIKGFTGDTLGAQNEITEIAILFAGGFIL